ncbi:MULTISPECIES: class I SAM-dependent methyltransferase [unclassified Streptomyces]|uniref:class I SAM-dependent methyltransferase n=1 Tax=unclassified Streptomyces TaxID=2593676 RepID=UPI00224DE590|nr:MULTISPECIES: class I SAM-dependent methyltransferase [unclassified Streptomyces]MCX4554316.1 class I SAM-dependent methyltransferase [Streptomyces sp. NBC_01500]WSC25024.1 class I SAM-dependent methyltransferase [Streptomyces sp. NBC_01766]
MNPTTSTPPALGERSAQYDAFHAARARTGLVARLYATAMGEGYPAEVAASSSCDWHLLGMLTARLRMQPGQLLVDAGCGTGGIGLWLARALALRLEGFDLSPVAVAQATHRRRHFLGSTDHAAFHVAELEDTGLPDSSAHGIVCVDTLGRATDRGAALCELGRVLAPGGRLILTRSLRRGAAPAWREQVDAAGLIQEYVDDRPAEPAMWKRLYQLWIEHAAELRHELGNVQADRMLGEAHRMLPVLPGRRAVLLTLQRPGSDPAAPGVADRMIRPSRRDDGPAPTERDPQ